MPAPLQDCETCPLRNYRLFAEDGLPLRACPYYIREVLAPAYVASAASEYNNQDPRIVYKDVKGTNLQTGTIQQLVLGGFLRGYLAGTDHGAKIYSCRQRVGNHAAWNDDEPLSIGNYLTESAPQHEQKIRDGVFALLKDFFEK